MVKMALQAKGNVHNIIFDGFYLFEGSDVIDVPCYGVIWSKDKYSEGSHS